MLLKKYRWGLLLFALFALVSCVYDSDATAYYDLTEPTDSTTATISFPGYNLQDTITLSNKDSISYLLTVSNGVLLSSVFQLDTMTLTTENGYIQIDTDTLFSSVSTYELTYSLHVSSGTGSLADIMDVEGINYDDSTMLYVKFDY